MGPNDASINLQITVRIRIDTDRVSSFHLFIFLFSLFYPSYGEVSLGGGSTCITISYAFARVSASQICQDRHPPLISLPRLFRRSS